MPGVFNDFELVSRLGGGQKKGKHAGIYIDQEGNIFVIKASVDIEGDDMAEVFSSRLLNKSFPQQFAECDFIQSLDNHLYVKSKFLEKYNPLYVHTGTKNFLFSFGKRKKVFKQLKDLGLVQDMANIVCGHMWVRNLDCHTENVGYFTANKKKLRVGAFDFGWGFANICKHKHYWVNPFETRYMYGKMADHVKRSGVPTNHFKDFPEVIFSQEMVNAITQLTEHSADSIKDEVEAYVDSCLEAYRGIGKSKIWVLSKLAKHIGLKADLILNDMLKGENTEEALDYIKERLFFALHHRLLSLNLNKKLIEAKLQLDSGRLTESPLELLKRIHESILEIKNGPDKEYLRNFSLLSKIIPPYGKDIVNSLLDKIYNDLKQPVSTRIDDSFLIGFSSLSSLTKQKVDKIQLLNSTKPLAAINDAQSKVQDQLSMGSQDKIIINLREKTPPKEDSLISKHDKSISASPESVTHQREANQLSSKSEAIDEQNDLIRQEKNISVTDSSQSRNEIVSNPIRAENSIMTKKDWERQYKETLQKFEKFKKLHYEINEKKEVQPEKLELIKNLVLDIKDSFDQLTKYKNLGNESEQMGLQYNSARFEQIKKRYNSLMKENEYIMKNNN